MKRSSPLRSSGFRRPELPRQRPVLIPRSEPARARMMTSAANEPVVSVPKDGAYRSEKWLRAVASLPCVICGREGTQAAHRNRGKSMGLKTDDCLTAALCPEHHREIDQGKDMPRDERRAVLDDAILRTVAELARRGMVGVVR